MTLVVQDDGPGIDFAERERVLDRFARLDDSRSRQSGGSGLGLAIVREVVEDHSGTVQVEPSVTAHAFAVRFPFRCECAG